MRALLDTSVFIARESGRPLAPTPETVEELAISVVTLAELRLGVLVADDDVRERRLRTYEEALLFEPLPIGVAVAERFADLIARTRRGAPKLKVMDAWIAATALVNEAGVVTQDGDFDGVSGLTVFAV